MKLSEKNVRDITIAGVAVAALAAGYPFVATLAIIILAGHLAFWP